MHALLQRRILPLAIGLVAATAVAGPGAAKEVGDWQLAEPVAQVNDPAAADGCPIEAPDGLSLYLASTRGPGGDNDIWVATRADKGGEFGTPTMLPAPVNSDAQDFCPTPLRGNHLLFVSTRGGNDAYGTTACGGGDIYLTRQSRVTGDWEEPRNLGCAPEGPNGPGTEYGPSLVETDAGTRLFFSSGGGVGTNTQDIYTSPQRADGSFGPREPVTELNTAYDDAMPNVSKDGREIVFTSSRPGGVGEFNLDIWSSTRSSVLDPWSAPVNLGDTVNTTAPETRPSLSWDGERLQFGRAGDIYMSHRAVR